LKKNKYIKEQKWKGTKTKCIPELQTGKRKKVPFFSRLHPNPSAINQKIKNLKEKNSIPISIAFVKIFKIE
jgi:hypothetical protein